ncbi:NAD-dependent epimerase/dehydratase family protein [Streptomyces naphthomycinicus]|uniref:NAD-dependent epimerase/dehydratase family protein n=1 Tax=Streptomyces naphthomycinicus TaxID=2872625 RepID=UPI001CECF287|nr:NAD-dependent epimerase/dehydratase family protein [Streptomyces sp. TML10]
MVAEHGPALVTGAAGFIGSALVAELRGRGIPVTAVDRIPWEEAGRLHPVRQGEGFAYGRLDLDEAEAGGALARLAQDSSVIYHLSANTENRGDRAGRLSDLRTTVGGTVALLEAVQDGRPTRVVLTSSQLVYAPDPTGSLITEKTGTLRPVSRFAAGKVAAEAFLSSYAHESGLRSTACRLSNIVGPGMRRGIIHDIVEGLERDPQVVRLLGDGRQTRSYLHVADCVRALIQAAGLGETFAVANVCNVDAISAGEVARIIAEEFPDGTPDILTADGEAGWRGDVPTLRVVPERLAAAGWQPAMDSRTAVRETARALFAEKRRTVLS